jgi:hypothetical protein
VTPAFTRNKNTFRPKLFDEPDFLLPLDLVLTGDIGDFFFIPWVHLFYYHLNNNKLNPKKQHLVAKAGLGGFTWTKLI